MKSYLKKFLGDPSQKRPPQTRLLREILWTCSISFLGIYAIYWANRLIGMGEGSNLYLIGSFGASAVLVYGAPASDYSQPRNLVGGHLISALAGVLMYKLFPDNAALAGALAVSLALAGMLATQTVHPPGGATALIAIVNPLAHDLGFGFLLVPVLTGALIMLITGVLMNNLSPNPLRRYPRYWF